MAAVVASKVRKQRAKDLNRKDNKEGEEEVKKREIKVGWYIIFYHPWFIVKAMLLVFVLNNT